MEIERHHYNYIRASFAALLCVLALGALGKEPNVERDWVGHPAIVQIDTQEDVYVMGDVHGDYERLLKVLGVAGIIAGKPAEPEAVEWRAHAAVLMFTGDLIDKWKYSIKVITLIHALQDKAGAEGGRVIVLMGNHEAEFLADPTEKKVRDFATELDDEGFSPEQVAHCRGDLGQFLCGLPFGARVNDWFFSHAGNTEGRKLSQLISDLQGGVDREGFGTPQLIGNDSILEARLGDRPWFDRDGSSEQEVLTQFADALGVAHLVQGHQPGKVVFADGVQRKSGAMFQRYGLIFLVDAGMSKGVDKSKGAMLRIKTTKFSEVVVICASGKKTKIWDDQSKPQVGKAAPCD